MDNSLYSELISRVYGGSHESVMNRAEEMADMTPEERQALFSNLPEAQYWKTFDELLAANPSVADELTFYTDKGYSEGAAKAQIERDNLGLHVIDRFNEKGAWYDTALNVLAPGVRQTYDWAEDQGLTNIPGIAPLGPSSNQEAWWDIALPGVRTSFEAPAEVVHNIEAQTPVGDLTGPLGVDQLREYLEGQGINPDVAVPIIIAGGSYLGKAAATWLAESNAPAPSTNPNIGPPVTTPPVNPNIGPPITTPVGVGSEVGAVIDAAAGSGLAAFFKDWSWLISGGVDALSKYYAGEKASDAQSEGYKLMTDAYNKAIDTQYKMYQEAREDFAPWRRAGEEAMTALLGISPQLERDYATNELKDLGYTDPTELQIDDYIKSAREGTLPWKSGLTDVYGKGLIQQGPGEFKPEEQPGYQFGYKNFIEQPYLSTQSAKGKRLSGETMKGLIGYASDYAETTYDNFLNRYYQKLNPYLSTAGLSQIGATGSAAASTQAGQSISNLQTGMGNMAYQNALAQGNIATGQIAGISGSFQNTYQNWLDQSIAKKQGVIP